MTNEQRLNIIEQLNKPSRLKAKIEELEMKEKIIEQCVAIANKTDKHDVHMDHMLEDLMSLFEDYYNN